MLSTFKPENNNFITSKEVTNYDIHLLDALDSVSFFLFNIESLKFDFISKSIKRLTGHDQKSIVNGGLNYINDHIHPSNRDFPVLLRNYWKKIKKGKGQRRRVQIPYEHSFIIRIKHAYRFWVPLETYLTYVSDSDIILGIFKSMERDHLNVQPNYTKSYISKYGRDSSGLNLVHKLNILKKPFNDVLYSNHLHETKISDRENEVLQLIGHGFSAKQIAAKLYISIHTAVNHRKNLISKFEVKNTAELIKVATKQRFL